MQKLYSLLQIWLGRLNIGQQHILFQCCLDALDILLLHFLRAKGVYSNDYPCSWGSKRLDSFWIMSCVAVDRHSESVHNTPWWWSSRWTSPMMRQRHRARCPCQSGLQSLHDRKISQGCVRMWCMSQSKCLGSVPYAVLETFYAKFDALWRVLRYEIRSSSHRHHRNRIAAGIYEEWRSARHTHWLKDPFPYSTWIFHPIHLTTSTTLP